MSVSNKRRFSLNTFQIIALGFAGVILIGAFILMLPISSSSKTWTSFSDALFTSTSSACVTGLVVHDTATYWSTFGHSVILLLIQIGGLGVITLAASFAMIAGRRIGLFQRSAMQEAVASPTLGGVVKLTIFILKATFTFELIGALIMAPTFIKDFGIGKGIWYSIFHSISAFCNAGFDLMGVNAPYSSMTNYVANPFINIAMMLLIIIGGLGFLTWDDVRSHGIHIKKYRMQSKVILLTTSLLILIPAVFFFFVEFSDRPIGERIFASLFQSITTRTAGFNTVDLTSLSEPSQMLQGLLMLVGGSPGSTAGGMKTTTLAVIIACAISVFKKRDSAQLFKRRISSDVISNAATILLLYLSLFIGSAMAISVLEGLPILSCLYETASAIGTTGLSLGITPGLGLLSRLILIFLMYIGRVGGLTLIYATISGNKVQMGKLPLDRITVG